MVRAPLKGGLGEGNSKLSLTAKVGRESLLAIRRRRRLNAVSDRGEDVWKGEAPGLPGQSALRSAGRAGKAQANGSEVAITMGRLGARGWARKRLGEAKRHA